MIQLTPEHYKIVAHLLAFYPYDFYVFGSRATGNAKEFSDLDLCCMGDIQLNEMGQLRGWFEGSNLPFTVDIVKWSKLKDEFKEIIKPQMIPFPKSYNGFPPPSRR